MASKKTCYSGIGGQAVMDGVMMKNKDRYAVAVRKPDGNIDVQMHNFTEVLQGSKIREIPFVRGTFNFVDSMILGTRALNESAEFFEEGEEETAFDRFFKKLFGDKAEKAMSNIVTVLSLVLAVAIFMILPYYLSSLLKNRIMNTSLLTLLEGGIRICIFLVYVLLISCMKDIRTLFRYHGAEHKCINCIEHGLELTVENVKASSRQHKRCGTSFIFFVFIVSVILFFFIRVENPLMRVGLRILLIPVVAGISYELIRLAGKSDNILVKILSAPGMLVQMLTTKEPDEKMIEVAIASVEAVFDWKKFQEEHADEL